MHASPGIGINETGDHHSGLTFFVIDADAGINTEKISRILRKPRYVINQLNNPESIIFQPGGIYKTKFLNNIHYTERGKGNYIKGGTDDV